jgi:DNA polymerase sigma
MDEQQRKGGNDPRRNAEQPPQQPQHPYYYPFYQQQQPFFYSQQQQPQMFYSPFEQQQYQQQNNNNQVTNPMLLHMFANQQYYEPFGMYGNMMHPQQNWPQQPHVEERRIESALRAMILNDPAPQTQPLPHAHWFQQPQTQQPQLPQQPPQPMKNIAPQTVDTRKNVSTPTNEINKSGTPVDDAQKSKGKKKKPKQPVKKVFTFDQSREPLQEEMLILPDLKLNRDGAAKATKTLIKLHKDLTPTVQELEKKDKFFNRLVGLIKGKWPDAQLNIFGSSASQLGVRGNSDIDVCLVIKFEPRVQKRSNSRTQSIEQELQKQLELEQQQEEQLEEDDENLPYEEGDEEEDDWESQGFSPEKDKNKRGKRKHKKRYRKVPLTEEQAMKRNYVSQLTQFLAKHHMRNIKPIFTARVPIVKFADPDSGLNCDVCVNNILAVYNTRLLRTYALLDIRCAQLIYLIKYWASMREINQPYLGTLSSYSYVLLVIHYLQSLPNPVLPVLQDQNQFPESSLPSTMVDGLDGNTYNCSYFETVSTKEDGKEPKFVTKNTDPVGELLVGFFKYYAYDFNLDRDIVTVRFTADTIRALHKEGDLTSPYTTKEEKGWTNYTELRNALCIEDPFETDFNVARTCTYEGLSQIQYELVRAYHLLCKQADLKSVVCARLSHNKAS